MAPIAVGIGLGVSFGGKAGAAAPAGSLAAQLLALWGGQGFALVAADNSLKIGDAGVPANDYAGVPGVKVVTTRASAAWYWSSVAGLAQAAINEPRLDYNPALGSSKPGYLMEESRTNAAKWSDDLTNVLWTKTNATAAKDQIGPDGVANSASSIVATGAGATVLQSITAVSQSRVQSAIVKRLVGSGTVEMTIDNVIWTAIPVTASWSRVEIPVQTLANPVVGFRFATSGDSIAVWCAQCEHAAVVISAGSSPIPTTSATVTRAVDMTKLAGTLFPLNQLEGTLYVKAMTGYDQPTGNHTCMVLDDGTATAESVGLEKSAIAKKLTVIGRDGGVIQYALTGTAVWGNLVPFKISTGYKLNDSASAVTGEAVSATDTACTMPTTNSITFGNRATGAQATLCGWILEAMYLPTRRTNVELGTLVA